MIMLKSRDKGWQMLSAWQCVLKRPPQLPAGLVWERSSNVLVSSSAAQVCLWLITSRSSAAPQAVAREAPTDSLQLVLSVNLDQLALLQPTPFRMSASAAVVRVQKQALQVWLPTASGDIARLTQLHSETLLHSETASTVNAKPVTCMLQHHKVCPPTKMYPQAFHMCAPGT